VIGHPDMPMVEHIGYPVVSLSFASLLVSAVLTVESRSWLQWFLNSAAMRTLGKYSYATYVWHGLVADLIYQAETRAFGRTLPQPLNIPILIAAALVVSMASYVVVERPFLRLKDRFQPRFEKALERAPAVIEGARQVARSPS
jgi:peptidoglycan/LPS O-acetylase OafA/YrhL